MCCRRIMPQAKYYPHQSMFWLMSPSVCSKFLIDNLYFRISIEKNATTSSLSVSTSPTIAEVLVERQTDKQNVDVIDAVPAGKENAEEHSGFSGNVLFQSDTDNDGDDSGEESNNEGENKQRTVEWVVERTFNTSNTT